MQILHRLWNIQLKYHTLRLVGGTNFIFGISIYITFHVVRFFVLLVCTSNVLNMKKIWYNTGHEIVERRKYYCFC